MTHAWLDSLSEDWVSQPGSDASDAQLPPLDSHANITPSRIPRRPGANPVYSPLPGSSSLILNERTTNEINIPGHKLPSKLSREVRIDSKNSHQSISPSHSSSVVQKLAESHSQNNAETPEWKRRLIYGELQYGEQRDLFCSAGTGLQDMFKPPLLDVQAQDEEAIASSPPIHQFEPDEDIDRLSKLAEQEEQDFPEQVTPSPSPRRGHRSIRFRPPTSTDDDSILMPSNKNHVDESPSQNVGALARNKVPLNAPHQEGLLRQASGETDFGNEDFSPILIGRQDEADGQVRFGAMDVLADELKFKLERVQQDQASDVGNYSASLGATIDCASDIEAVEYFARNAGQVNLGRGGRSGDGSFYSRALSPDLGNETSEMLPEDSLQASTPKQFPTIRNNKPPARSALQSTNSPALPRAPFPSPEKRTLEPSGSPLKLFGPYDTFTNQTLLRRISQFENIESSGGQGIAKESPDVEDSMDQSRRSVSYFGDGQLDDFEFTADLSEAYDMHNGKDKENVLPETLIFPTGSLRPTSFRNVSSKLSVSRQREKARDRAEIIDGDQQTEILKDAQGTPARDLESLDSKRSRNSPTKDPTPKRRRTLRRSDATQGRKAQLSQVDAAHQQMQSVVGKKRKDARPGLFEVADAEILAGRVILKPCSPASSRKSSKQYGVQGGADKSRQAGGDKKTEAERKTSIRTQDFVDQAAQIMAMIRNQVKPVGLPSLEESVEEHNTGVQGDLGSPEGSQADSTVEPLSRPPSREGKLSFNYYQERRHDPELEARLKQYREISDMGDIVTSSLRSVSMAQEAIRVAQQVERKIQQLTMARTSATAVDMESIVTDLGNVRISGPFANSSLSASPAPAHPSQSSMRSINNTIPTTSSTNSDSRRTIMPESVSHLIPDRVGSMYLDKNQNIWIKKKDQNPPEPKNDSIVASDESEEDPFASIPDLTVDMTQELRGLRGAANRDEFASTARWQSSPLSLQNRCIIPLTTAQDKEKRETVQILKTEKRFTNEAGGGDAPRETAKRRNMTISFSSPIASMIQDAVATDADGLEEAERSAIDYDRSFDQSPPDNIAGQRAMPRADARSKPPTMRYTSLHGPPDFARRPVSPITEQDEDGTVELHADENNQISFIGEHCLMNRGQESSRQASLSVIISRTPGHKSLALVGDDSAIIGHNIGNMSLSPLSQFDMHQADQSFGFEVSYVLGNRHLSTGDRMKKVMSLTLRDLVERLSEVEPCEPYWQDLEELNLSDKRLSSLHMLHEFCGKIVTLDASRNALGHLEGVPQSVRQLKVSQNMLTELTSWNHLVNLQYVDISGNQIRSLSALRNLVHLRSVKADDNKLTSLDGLESHEGLLSLRARDNLIEEVDFAETTLSRLTELDLAGNVIEVVRNVHRAPRLSKLNLGRNKLKRLEMEAAAEMIRHLDIGQNKLKHLDVSSLPNLHTLIADGNELSTISGLHRTRRLDSLSLREQRSQCAMDLGFLSVGYEMRKLFLSGNYLDSFAPKVDMLNLQLLELANCGLSSIAENFGQLVPNLRCLNLNFNGILDVRPLQYIPRLKKLLVAGNRLSDSTAVTKVLMEFPHLARLDTRDNPMTLGYYGPIQTLVERNGKEVPSPFTLPDGDEEGDKQFASRLDQPTKLRRRLHQVVLAASCGRLRMLDGLPMRRRQVLTMDTVLEVLVKEGLVESPTKGGEEDEEETALEADEMVTQRGENGGEEAEKSPWEAEDSFA